MILKKNEAAKQNLYLLFAGEYFVGLGQIILSTLLGSCVTVCLYDLEKEIGGINHFIVPEDNAMNIAPFYDTKTRYGTFAMEILINEMLKKGATRENLRAKVFGGASILMENNEYHIGIKNVNFALKYLELEKIPVTAKDIGGTMGRKIYFIPATGKVYLKRFSDQHLLNKIEHKDFEKWQQQVDDQQEKKRFIDFSCLD
jgi:chemotaxis protein CheD